ncbi:hypothetical protein SprV_0602238700 [Sparganum proliferum]
MPALLQNLLWFVVSVTSCYTLFERNHCPLRERSVDLATFVEDSLNDMPPLTYALPDEQLRTVIFRLQRLAAVKGTTCSILRIMREAKIIQFLCSTTFPSLYLTLEKEAWEWAGEELFSHESPDLMRLILKGVKADIYVTYLYDINMRNTLKLTNLIFANLSQTVVRHFKGIADYKAVSWKKTLPKVDIWAQAAFLKVNNVFCVAPAGKR